MPRNWTRASQGVAALLTAIAVFNLAGCGTDGPKTYPVHGRVVLEGGDVKSLAGSNVEFQLESDPQVRAYGLIQDDGRFSLGMLHKGKPIKGAVEGTHLACITLGGEDDEETLKRSSPVHLRYLDFKTSKLSYKVPTDGEITVKVSKK